MNGQVVELAANFLSKAERFVALAFDDIALIVAQTEIRALEPVLDVKPLEAVEIDPKHGRAAGVLSIAEQTYFVYALDGELNRLSPIPERHRICAIMNHRDAPYALSCNEVRLLRRSELSVRDIPKPLTSSRVVSPIKWLVINEDRLLLGTTAAALLSHVIATPNAEIIPFNDRLRKARS